jgi:hypothetical protein
MEIMAKPTGAVDFLDFPHTITSAGDTRDSTIFYSYMYAVAKVDLQPGKWETTNKENTFHSHDTAVSVKVGTGATVIVAVRVGKEVPDPNNIFLETGPTTPVTWLSGITEEFTASRTIPLPNYDPTKTVPRYMVIEIIMSRNQTSTLTETAEVGQLFIEAVNDTAYSGNDVISFNNNVKKINKPFDSLSAYMMKDAIVENLNKIMYCSSNAFCIQLFGDF